MTLMNAPKYDAAGSQRRSRIVLGSVAAVVVFVVGMWFFTGRPVDVPWTWWTYWAGERDVNQFLQAVEGNDLPRAYAVWNNDFDWQRHPDQYKTYPFDRFKEDWAQGSAANEYGTISSHKVVGRKMSGGVLIVASMINGRKSKPLFLAFDKKEHTIGFSPFDLKLD